MKKTKFASYTARTYVCPHCKAHNFHIEYFPMFSVKGEERFIGRCGSCEYGNGSTIKVFTGLQKGDYDYTQKKIEKSYLQHSENNRDKTVILHEFSENFSAFSEVSASEISK